MGSYERNKGHDWERENARDLTEATGEIHERNLVESRTGNTGDIVPDNPFLYQCKVGARPPIYKALKQAVEAAESHPEPRIGVALIKRNSTGGGKPPDLLAIMRKEDYQKMLNFCLKNGFSLESS